MRRRFTVAFLLLACATPASASNQATLSIPVGSFSQDSNNVLVKDGSLVLGPGAARSASARIAAHTGIALYPPSRLAQPVNTVSARVESTGAEVAVDVRGALPDGNWTEWTETPAVLSVATSVVQVRLVLTAPDGVAGPEVRNVDLTMWTTEARPLVQAQADSYRVYATREGLVGGTTANGHVITSRDHFVALPSRRGLASKNTGAYSVQVCAANGRCEWAPVWDVGPWNTRDDYWSMTRESWPDLPRGTPQAQAAHQDKYNDGKDQFGRKVANPAGIDLADGTFWDGLKLTGNSWVTVTYLWTGSGASGFVQAVGDTLNVRNAPNTNAAVVGLAAHTAQVRVECEATGESVDGSQGTSDIWYRIAAGKYMTKAFVSGVTGAPAC
jgi:hypothetical protein